jgi:uncharacterized DUF497 family protein
VRLEFEWDENKNRANQAKHGISFESAVEVFEDPLELTNFDQFIDGEDRWKTIGRAGNNGVLLVVHVERDYDDGSFVRIISARPATRQERRRYEQRQNG